MTLLSWPGVAEKRGLTSSFKEVKVFNEFVTGERASAQRGAGLCLACLNVTSSLKG